MAAIIKQYDKRSGITYFYESISYWDKKKQQSRAKRKLIGKLNITTGEMEPTTRKLKKDIPLNGFKEKSRLFYGAVYLLDSIGDNLGIVKDLKRCFPTKYKQILSIAYFLILEDSSSLFRFEKWHKLHKHPYNKNIPSQRSSELFASITESEKSAFFKLQGKRRNEKEFWAYDTTSISSYSEKLKKVKRGYNKENDPLSQINLAMVFGGESKLPFYYRSIAGNIPDAKTVQHLILELNRLGFKKIKLVMDRGFYSEYNLNKLFQNNIKFLIATKLSLKFIRQNLDTIFDEFRSFKSYNEDYKLYSNTIKINWDYEPIKKGKGSKKRIYIHYYFNLTKAAEDEQKFDCKIFNLREELLLDNRTPEHEKLYTKYFHIKTTPKRGTKVTVKNNIIAKEKRYFGFFALLSNETMTSIEALEIYRNKDLVEKAFGNLKERLNMRRVLVSSEESLNGKLFIEFIALIYLSYIKKKMQEKSLFKEYTLQGILDELDIIECFEEKGKRIHVGEVLKKQEKIYLDLNVAPPSSL